MAAKDKRVGWLADLVAGSKVIIAYPMLGGGPDELHVAVVKQVLPSGYMHVQPFQEQGAFTFTGRRSGGGVLSPRMEPCTPEAEALASRQAKERELRHLVEKAMRRLHVATAEELEALRLAAWNIYLRPLKGAQS